MSDLIFAGEIDWSCVTDADVGAAMVSFFRQNPQALPKKVKAAIAQATIMQDQINRTIEKADAEERNAKFGEWVELFLKSKSSNTRKNYQYALDRLFAFCRAEGIEAANLTYEQARRFTTSPQLASNNKRGGRRNENSIRTDIAAVSALYSELDRLSEGKIRNPFIRIDTKPSKQRASGKAVPNDEEVAAILENTDGVARAAIAVMSYRGLRIGALPGLELTTYGGKTTFETFTKGKPQTGVMPKEAMDAIKQAGLDTKTPFAGIDVKVLTKKVEAQLNRVAAMNGLIPGQVVTRKIHGKPKDIVVADYSCHSFRHYYAVTEYNKDFNVDRVRKLLNHSDLNTTQVYLQSLGCIEE